MADVIKRTQKEIDDLLVEAEKYADGNSKFWGMNYEEGLIAMHDWLTEDEPECNPMDG